MESKMTNVDEIIKSIMFELGLVRQSIKDKNFKKYALETLIKKEKELQVKLNELLQKKGLKITETEADKIYEELRLFKRSKLEANIKRGNTGFYVAGIILLLGIYFAYKKIKK